MNLICGNVPALTTTPSTCHCGALEIWHAYTHGNGHPGGWTRHLCEHCDAVRCDAYPGECVTGRETTQSHNDNPVQ